MNLLTLFERLSPLVNLALRYPIENHFRRHQKLSGIDELRELAASAAASPASAASPSTSANPVTTEEKPPVATPSPPEAPAQILVRKGLDEERMAYQESMLRADLWLAEGHLKSFGQGCGGDLECLFKHGENLIDGATETKSMTTDPYYDEVIAFGKELKAKCHPDDVKAGTYAHEYPRMAIRAAELRLPLDKKLMERAKAPITLEEAKAEAARLAKEQIEKAWVS